MIPLEDVQEPEDEYTSSEQYPQEPTPAAAPLETNNNASGVNLDMLSSLLNNGQLMQLLSNTQLNGQPNGQHQPTQPAPVSSYPPSTAAPSMQALPHQASPASYNHADPYLHSRENAYHGSPPAFSGVKHHRPNHNPGVNRHRVNKKFPRGKKPHPKPQGDPSTIPCYFFENGNCARKNCPFLHR